MESSRTVGAATTELLVGGDLEQRKERCSQIAERLMVNLLTYNLERTGNVDCPECLKGTSEQASPDGTENGRTSENGVRPLPGSRHSNSFLIVRYLTKIVRERYNGLFQSMMEELRPTPQTAYPQFVGVTAGLFQDEISHGRIVSLIVFCNELAVYCMEKPHLGQQFVASVLAWFTRYYNSHLAQWMAERNGWVGLEDNFSRFVPKIGTVDESGLIIPFDESDVSEKKGAWRLVGFGLALGALAVGYGLSQ